MSSGSTDSDGNSCTAKVLQATHHEFVQNQIIWHQLLAIDLEFGPHKQAKNFLAYVPPDALWRFLVASLDGALAFAGTFLLGLLLLVWAC
jgi:hypothetical protein